MKVRIWEAYLPLRLVFGHASELGTSEVLLSVAMFDQFAFPSYH